MTGGSLGLRLSGSCRSLQKQTHNGNFYLPRRSSKTSLPGCREKERFLPSTFRYLCRRKVGMLILAAFALLALMTGFFTVNKEDDFESRGLIFDARYLNKSYDVPSLLPGEKPWQYDSHSNTNKPLVCNGSSSTSWEARLNASAVGDSSSAVTFTNPCKDFAFLPPPPGYVKRGPRSCPVCYVPVEQAIARMPKSPSLSPIHHLSYISEKNPLRTDPFGGSDFGGYPSLRQRNDSVDIKESMTVHCGMPTCYQTGFDIGVADLELLEEFNEVIVASAIFGNYDVIQQPRNIGETAKNNVPFFMFIDEETEAYMKKSGVLGNDKKVGLWRIILVHNVPYIDPRRNGKVPKLLLHRLFPNSRFSIWVDGKLQLVVDPYQILERFLWPKRYFAISRHYTRFDVFEEAEANKRGGKYDNISIDYQIEFYKSEGLTHYTNAKLPITSDVPEGCTIIREHTGITNLFSCLWFNEVDRFISRDQLSFSTVRDKVMAKVDWSINMFLDCERHNFVLQAYHEDLLDQRDHMAFVRTHSPPPPMPPPPAITHEKNPPKKIIVQRGKDKRPSSRRRRRVTPKTKENSV